MPAEPRGCLSIAGSTILRTVPEKQIIEDNVFL